MPAAAAPRRLTTELRWAFVVVGVLLLLAGVVTFGWSDETGARFAWTIDPPITAAFMGAGYWGSVALVLLAARERVWARARIAVPAALAFSVAVMAATIVHFGRFHRDRPITWAWVGIYAVVPVLLAALALRQLRLDGVDPPREAPLPSWAKAVLAGQAAVLLPLGVALLAVPETVDALWPWPLTPLTGRIVGAWALGLGVGAVHGAWEGDWLRLRPGAANYAVFGGLQLVVVARYPDAFAWDDARSWLYLLFVATMIGFGVEALRRAGRRRAPHEAEATA